SGWENANDKGFWATLIQPEIVRALTNLAIVTKDQGDLAGARKMEEESLAIRRQIGNKVGVGIALNNLAVLLIDQGDLAGSSLFISSQGKAAVIYKNDCPETIHDQPLGEPFPEKVWLAAHARDRCWGHGNQGHCS
ncbi:MAG: tetratricopeptide repeat protein, partial [Terriglobales bacterium]